MAQTEFSRVPVLQGGIRGLTYCFPMFRPPGQLRANVQGFPPASNPQGGGLEQSVLPVRMASKTLGSWYLCHFTLSTHPSTT